MMHPAMIPQGGMPGMPAPPVPGMQPPAPPPGMAAVPAPPGMEGQPEAKKPRLDTTTGAVRLIPEADFLAEHPVSMRSLLCVDASV